MKNFANFFSNINWKKVGKYSLFYLKAFLVILARLVYLLVYELVKFTKKAAIFSYELAKKGQKEFVRRKIWPKTKRALHIGAAITWLLSKKFTKEVIKQAKGFVVFATPHVKKFTKLVIKYSRRAWKRAVVILTYMLIRIQKTERYKKLETVTKKQVVAPLLKTATSRKPYAIALMVILFVTSSFVFLHDNSSFAATNTWTQTDWSGGQGSSTSNQYSSVSGLATSTDLSLATNTWMTAADVLHPYRTPITIDADQVSGSSDLTNFIVLINSTSTDWRSTGNGGNVAQTDGGDILFADSSGNQLEHEIESYTATSGNLIAWVRVPALDYNDDTTIYMYYGNDEGSLDYSNAEAVWPTDEYVGVYHLNEDATAGATSATHYDSTANSNDGSQYKNNDTVGKIGTGQQVDTYGDYILVNAINDELDEPLDEATISLWVYRTTDSSSALAFSAGNNGDDRIWFYEVGSNWSMTRSADGGASKAVSFADSTTPLNTWSHITMTWDVGADEQKAFINGTQQGSTQTGIDSFTGTFSTSGNVQIGGFGGANLYGSYDELRIHRSARSSDWLTTEYNNQNAPETFYTVGSEDSATKPEYRIPIIIDSDLVSGSSNLTDFPVLVSHTADGLRSTGNGGNVAGSSGEDIMFVLADGTALVHEIETYNATTGELIAWVRFPTLDYNDDTSLYVYYGGDTDWHIENPFLVWPTDEYAAVYHLGETVTDEASVTGAHLDSTANNNDGNQIKNDEVAAKIGIGQDFDGTGDYFRSTALADEFNASQGTISYWMNVDAYKSAGQPGYYLSLGTWPGGSDNITHSGNVNSGSFTYKANSITDSINIGAPTTAEDTWAYHTATWNISDDEFKYFVNGSQIGSTASTLGTFVSPITYLDFASGNGNYIYDMMGDELRLLRVSRSADWLTTEYNNQNDPSTFAAFGSEQSEVGPTGYLESASFDTGDGASLITQISWTETLPANTDITFQMRTSPDDATWTDWLGPTGTGDYYTDAAGGESINSTHADGSDDRYIQYKVFLSNTDNSSNPTLSDVIVQYSANTEPEFNDDYPSASAGGSQASVSTDGNSTVTINYSVRDTDSSSGTATPGYVTPSFEYSLNGGSTWSNIATSTLTSGDWDNKAVDESDYNIYSATWDAETTVGTSVYVTNARIRTTVNDNEGGNNTATSTTANFTLDTTSPAVGATPMTVDASVSPANVTLSCADDTALEQQIGLASDLSDVSYVSYTGTATVSGVGTPTDVIYGQCRDAYGNETAIQSVTTPTQPTNMYYQDISNVSESDYSLFISWSTVPAPSAGFASYRLYRSTDGSNYSLYQTIATRTTNYYIDTGLSTGTTYYYKLYVLDNDGNKSSYSAVVSDDPDGSGGTDNTSPMISAVSATSTPMEATITWTTDELSNSTVYYEATAIDPGTDSANYDLSQGIGSFVTSHSIALANLTPGTQYYYLVRSTDVNNNIGTDSSSGTFTTGAGVSISSVSASTIYNEEATITWNTDSPADSTVYYSTNSDMSGASSISSASTTQAHAVNLTSLTGGTTYYFYVESAASGNTTSDKNVVDGVTEYYSFTTTSDATAPTISNVTNALIGETGVTIAWTTDEGATSQVFWGPSASLGSTTTETAVYTTQHAVTLTGLQNEKKYYYKVRSKDRANNSVIDDNSSALYTVTTNEPGGGGGGIFINPGDTIAPTAEDISESPSQNSATITFTTDEPAGVLFGWGEGNANENEINKTNIFQTSHVFVIDDLSPNTTYYYKIVTIDVNSNERERRGSFETIGEDDPDPVPVPLPEGELDLGEIDTEVEGIIDEEGETESVDPDTDIAELTRNAAAGTVREVLESVFENRNLFNIPSDFLLQSASKLASNFDHSVVSNEELEKSDQEFLFEGLRIAAVTGQNATVVWRTTVPTKSTILLTDLRTGQTRELSDPSFLLAHEYTVNRLEPTASYSLQVVAENELGERLGSQALSFSTFVDRSEPVISELRTTTSILPGKENKVQAIVTWKTNKPTTSRVLYEAGVGEGNDFALSSANNQSFTYEHVVVVSGLQPGQVYRMRAESVDGQGTAVYSTDRTLITPRSKESIVDVIIENFEQTFGFLR